MTFLSKIMKLKTDPIEKKLSMLQCKELTRSQSKHIVEFVDKISEKFSILKPTMYYSDRIKNNAYTEKGLFGKNVIIISENLLKNLSDSQLELIMQHEMFHLKAGTKKTIALNDLLADAFTVLREKNFDEMKNTVLTITPSEPPPILTGFHECFITHGKGYKKTKERREEIQRKRREEYEKDSFLRRVFIHHWQFENENPNNWVDAVHSSNNKSEQIIYDKDVRTEFLNDLQMICETNTEIVTTPHARKILEFPKGDIRLHNFWFDIFKIHNMNEKLDDEVFRYIQEHENKFNLTDCAKNMGRPEFVILLAVLQLIMYRKIVLMWRFPCKYNFDY